MRRALRLLGTLKRGFPYPLILFRCCNMHYNLLSIEHSSFHSLSKVVDLEHPPSSFTGSTAFDLLIVFLLVLANSFFVASEFALVSVRKTRIDQLAAEGNRTAGVVQRAVRDLGLLVDVGVAGGRRELSATSRVRPITLRTITV